MKADPNCMSCRGSGTLIENERIIDGEYWCAFVDCYCVPIVPIYANLQKRLSEIVKTNGAKQ